MSLRIIDKTIEVKSFTSQKANIFLRLMSDKLIELSEPNTPKRKGNLRTDILKQTLGLKSKVIWGKGYAAYQERGARKDGSRAVRNYTTGGTGAHFAENAARKLPEYIYDVARKAGML